MSGETSLEERIGELEDRLEHNELLHRVTLQKIEECYTDHTSRSAETNKKQFRKKVHDIVDICLTTLKLGADTLLNQKTIDPRKTSQICSEIIFYVDRVNDLLGIIDHPKESIHQDIIPIITQEDISDFYQERYERITEYMRLLCENPKSFYAELLKEINLEKLEALGEQISDLIEQNSTNHYSKTIIGIVKSEIENSIDFIQSTLTGEKNPYPHDVFYLIEENIETAEHLILENNYVLNIHVAENVEKITIDQPDFNKIFFNLLTNAIKYGRSKDESSLGKPIDIYAFKTSRKCRDYLTILVADSGVGIREQDADKIFNYEFMSEDDSIMPDVKRHGVGLNNVLDVIDELNGELFFINRKKLNPESQGSIFGVRIPYQQKQTSIFDVM